MSTIASSGENRGVRRLGILLAAMIGGSAALPAIASPPELGPEARGCMPTERLPPLPMIRSDNTAKQLLAYSDEIDRIEIFDPVERRVITTLVGRDLKLLSAMVWFAETPEIQWIAQAQTIGRISNWRTVLLIYPKDHSEPFLAHPLSLGALRLQRKHPYVRGDVTSTWRDPKIDVYVDDHHMWRLSDAFESVRPLDDFCPTTIPMPDCELEQARRAHEPVQPPQIRKDNTASKLIGSRKRITRVKIWSEWHRGVVGELDEAEVAALIEQLGATTSKPNEWDGSSPPWDAVLLVYTKGSELPFAVHVISHLGLRISPSDPMSPAIWPPIPLNEDGTAEVNEDEEPRMQEPLPGLLDLFVEHDLIEILSRYLGPEDPFWDLRFERERELRRRCHLHSGIDDDPWPELPFARIE